jgi:type I restriction enzyme, S subunit
VRYKPYREYKNSGVEWLGEIPEHWSRKRLNLVAKQYRDAFVDGPFGSDLKSNEYKTSGTPLIQLNNIKEGIHIVRNMKFISDRKKKQLKRHIARHGDIVIAKMAEPVARATIINQQYDEYVIVADCVRLTPNLGLIDSNYLVYAINSRNVRLGAELVSTGTTRIRINLTELKKLWIPYPAVKEQQSIATYLDKATSMIDILIAKQSRLIELLIEKRQAVISTAVTRGLDGSIPMKDSGVEWLGEIPGHWKTKKFKYLFQIRKRIAGELGFKILSITQAGIKVKDVDSGKGQLSSDYSKYQHVYRGDYAMNHMDLLTGFVDLSKYDGVTSPDYRVFSLIEKDSNSEYYLYLLQMGYINKLFYPLGQGSSQFGRWRLPTNAFKEFQAPFPPVQEQEEIALSIKHNLDRFSLLTMKAARAIELLKEKRTALISAAVTGKIDLRGKRYE